MSKDVDLTDSVAEALILKLCKGKKPEHRDAIGEKVLARHLERGGRDPNFKHFSRFIGPLLGGLEKKGKARFHAPKYWRGETAKDSVWEIIDIDD